MPSILEIPAEADHAAVVVALVTRGQEFAKEGKYDQAYESFGHALALDPDSPLVLINYGAALSDGKRFGIAKEFTEKGLQVASTDKQRAICLNNLGHMAHVRREFDLADRLLRESISRDPDYKPPLISLGANLVLQARWDEAMEVFDEASLLYPGDWEPLMNRAILKLTIGDWKRGLPGYEHRKLMEGAVQFESSAKAQRWRGEDLAGQIIAIWPDQGLGDCVYCHRLVNEVARRAAHVYFMTYVPLEGVLPIFPNVTQLREGDRADLIHYQAPVMSLMYGLRIDPENPPPPTGLVTNPHHVSKEGVLNVGLCLSGNPSHKYDDLRSIPASMLAEVGFFDIDGIAWHWLNKEMREYDKPVLYGHVDRHDIDNVFDLASITNEMDLVITVDTLTLHVAGELGKPTIGLIPFSPDFRWGVDSDYCPWYPSVKLLRCRKPVGDWPNVVGRLKTEIEGKLK